MLIPKMLTGDPSGEATKYPIEKLYSMISADTTQTRESDEKDRRVRIQDESLDSIIFFEINKL